MNLNSEPIRLPLWVTTLLSVVIIPFVISVLTGISWQDALAGALSAALPLLGVGEYSRRKVCSPNTIAKDYILKE